MRMEGRFEEGVAEFLAGLVKKEGGEREEV